MGQCKTCYGKGLSWMDRGRCPCGCPLDLEFFEERAKSGAADKVEDLEAVKKMIEEEGACK